MSVKPKGLSDKKPRKQRKAKVTRAMAEGLVKTVNLFLQMIPLTAEDALNEIEEQAWILSIVDLAARNEFAANVILKIVTVQSTGRIGLCILGTAGPRLARRGLIPEEIGQTMAGLTYIAAGEGFGPVELDGHVEDEPVEAEPMAAG